jgi:hypothetical protein
VISRRGFLGGAMVFGGALASPYRGVRQAARAVDSDCECQGNMLGIEVVAGDVSGLAALVATTGSYEVVALDRRPDGSVTVGRPRPMHLPTTVTPAAFDLAPDGLLVGGAEEYGLGLVEIDYGDPEPNPPEMHPLSWADAPTGLQAVPVTQLRPALFVVRGERAERIEVPGLPDWPFGSIVAVASRPDGSLVLLIVHGEHGHPAHSSAIDVVERSASGRWMRHPVLAGYQGLGACFVAESSAGLFVVVSSALEGVSVLHQRRGRFERTFTRPGRALAVASDPSEVRLVASGPDGTTTTRLDDASGSPRSNRTLTPAGDVVQVNGFARELVVVSSNVAQVRKAAEI